MIAGFGPYNLQEGGLIATRCETGMSEGFPARDGYSQVEDLAAPVPSVPTQRRVLLPVLLFAATCYTTLDVGGPVYAGAIMFTLLCHEFGHFFQSVRYGVPASFPIFIPLPAKLSPIGTMGAVIVMKPYVGDRRAIFDIGITGPLAGLVPAVVFSVIGLHWSHVVDTTGLKPGLELGEPLLFKALEHLMFGPLGPHEDVAIHPLAFAGWVGVFITALNLIPIGQLDGGHVLYGILLRRSYPVAQAMLLFAMLGVVLFGYWGWSLMILLLMFMGALHPPTANDDIPLGTGRTILGWATLCFVPIGFTPVPFTFATG
jgi:membrane-associated protease RseP (regulator of RpoE activity)